MANSEYRVKIINKISQINSDDWDALVENNNPFIKHAFLVALERHNCVSAEFGWLPQHITVYNSDNQLVAAMPVYEKHNNYGEFVFDQAWEQAWNQIGLPYYPKLVSAIPYTPAMGQRLLTRNNLSDIEINQLYETLYTALGEQCENQNMSGAHILFPNQAQQTWLASKNDSNLYVRYDCQFHWQNQNYQCFDDFLGQLKSKKRNNIKRERRELNKLDIQYRVLDGLQTTQKDWQDFNFFYQKTFVEKWSTPTLNLAFFLEIAETLADHIVLVLADFKGECIAGALMFKSDTHLYGRHWGSSENIKNLHFEVCFYQGIEYAIKHKLQTFEPGAGGEHKIARGFTPVQTRSYHWLPLNPFGEALNQFTEQEKRLIDEYMTENQASTVYLSKHS